MVLSSLAWVGRHFLASNLLKDRFLAGISLHSSIGRTYSSDDESVTFELYTMLSPIGPGAFKHYISLAPVCVPRSVKHIASDPFRQTFAGKNGPNEFLECGTPYVRFPDSLVLRAKSNPTDRYVTSR
jgi:hypothetical protein